MSFKIEQLEEQCSEINREKEKNTQLKSRIEELESELREKETVSEECRVGPSVTLALHGDLCDLRPWPLPGLQDRESGLAPWLGFSRTKTSHWPLQHCIYGTLE